MSLTQLTIIAYMVDDIGGEKSYTWLGIANSLATAAISPATGAISDLIGRRYVLLCGSALVVAGMVIVGLAGRMDGNRGDGHRWSRRCICRISWLGRGCRTRASQESGDISWDSVSSC